METLARVGEYDLEQAFGTAAYDLNQWISKHEPSPNWEVDPKAKRLPRAIRQSDLLDRVGDWTFNRHDVEVIHEAILLRDISRWVAKKPVNEELKTWLEENETLGDLQREELAIAERLFDWIVRNIQLEETTPYPDETARATAEGQTKREQRLPAPQRAVPGPGYKLSPRESLLYGYGDALQRSRLFILLARQQGIDAVYLAFPGRSIPPRPRPWVVGVLLGQELYLFDCELGLPIPGPDGDGIATLSQVLDRPQLLEALDVGDFEYPVDENELTDIIALLHAAPSGLSQRMELVERNLAGDQRTILTASPSQLGKRVNSFRGVATSNIWSVPYEAIWFREAREKLIQNNQEAAMGYYAAVGVFQNQGPLVRGRHYQLKGKFEGGEQGENAKSLYLQCRIPNDAIAQLETSKQVQRSIGLVRGPREGDVVWRSRLANAKLMAIQSKQHSTYWLGLCHYDTGNYDSAIAFFRKRTLEAELGGPWTYGARYNLARTHEAIGNLQRARELLLEDAGSPQEHGNQLRAKLLQQKMRIREPAEG